MEELNQNHDIYGLLLAGGKSSRMKQDKNFIDYHRMPQVEYCYKLLKKFCNKVFVSLRKGQGLDARYGHYLAIIDYFDDIGPLGGILSAFKKYPNKAWLVLATDLPFVEENTLNNIIQKRNTEKAATAYKSQYTGLPEPLCALYEPIINDSLFKYFKKGLHCPKKILSLQEINLLKLNKNNELDNINTKEEFNAFQNNK